MRDVVKIKVSPLGGQKAIQIEAYVVPELFSIQNNHVVLVRHEYPHLKDFWFSEISKGG